MNEKCSQVALEEGEGEKEVAAAQRIVGCRRS